MLRQAMIFTGAVALATSTAFAAGFDINEADSTLDDISTGTVDVSDCTTGVLLDVVPGAYDADQDDWEVASVRVTNVGNDLASACEGFEVTAMVESVAFGVEGAATTTRSSVTHLIVAGDAEVDLPILLSEVGEDDLEVSLDPIYVQDVEDVAVLVDEPNLVLEQHIASWVEVASEAGAAVNGGYTYWRTQNSCSWSCYYDYRRDVTTTTTKTMEPVYASSTSGEESDAPCPADVTSIGSTTFDSGLNTRYYSRAVSVTTHVCDAGV